MGKSGKKNRICSFQMKFGTHLFKCTEFDGDIHVFVLDRKFFRQIYSKRIKLFKIKFDAQTNSNMMNLIVMLNFGPKILLGENLAQKCKFPVKNQIQY